MKSKVHLIDMRFNPNGHFLGDLREFEDLDRYSIKYSALGNVIENIDIDIDIDNRFSKSQWIKLFFFMLFNRNGNIVFLSCSYLPLFFTSLVTLNFNYYFRFTSMPYVRIGLYQKIIKILSVFSNGVIVCDYPVSEFLVESLNIDRKKISVLIGRTINKNNYKYSCSQGEGNKINVTFVGALNNEKDLTMVLKVICDNAFNNIRFCFYSKGIEQYKDQISAVKKNDFNDVVFQDKFLSNDEFNNLIDNADYLLIPYKLNYGIRASAILFDAMKLGKKAITIALPQFLYFEKEFNLCKTYKDEVSMIDLFNTLNNEEIVKGEELFSRYSKPIFIKQFDELFS